MILVDFVFKSIRLYALVLLSVYLFVCESLMLLYHWATTASLQLAIDLHSVFREGISYNSYDQIMIMSGRPHNNVTDYRVWSSKSLTPAAG